LDIDSIYLDTYIYTTMTIYTNDDSFFSNLHISQELLVRLLITNVLMIAAVIYLRSRFFSTPFANAILKSRLRDEFSYTSKPNNNQPFKVLSLWIYPVKGCRGIELKKSEVVETG